MPLPSTSSGCSSSHSLLRRPLFLIPSGNQNNILLDHLSSSIFCRWPQHARFTTSSVICSCCLRRMSSFPSFSCIWVLPLFKNKTNTNRLYHKEPAVINHIVDVTKEIRVCLKVYALQINIFLEHTFLSWNVGFDLMIQMKTVFLLINNYANS